MQRDNETLMGEVCCVLLSLITAEKVFFVVLKETNIAIRMWRGCWAEDHQNTKERSAFSVCSPESRAEIHRDKMSFFPSPSLFSCWKQDVISIMHSFISSEKTLEESASNLISSHISLQLEALSCFSFVLMLLKNVLLCAEEEIQAEL